MRERNRRAVTAARRSVRFMTEDEQSDDPEMVRRWIEDLRSIPPVPDTSEQEAKRVAWEERMRVFNIEAVRQQFEEAPR